MKELKRWKAIYVEDYTTEQQFEAGKQFFRCLFPEAVIIREEKYWIRVKFPTGFKYDFHPKKCKVFSQKTQQWYQLDRPKLYIQFSKLMDAELEQVASKR